MRADAPLPVLLCFDVEPDDKIAGDTPDWSGFPALLDLLTPYRARFAQATGEPCRFSWFVRMDPQVRALHGREDWAAIAFARELATVQAEGDEIGLHVHAWQPSGENWVSDFRDPTWIAHCVYSSVAAYQRCFAAPCRSFRFGDRFMDHDTMLLLDALEVRYDLTLEPGERGFPVPPELDRFFLGERPDFTGVPRTPYHPSTRNYRTPGRWPGRLRITEIPISTADGGTLFLAAEPDSVCRGIDGLIADAATCHLAMPARSDVAVRDDERRNFETILDHLLAQASARALRFATPSML